MVVQREDGGMLKLRTVVEMQSARNLQGYRDCRRFQCFVIMSLTSEGGTVPHSHSTSFFVQVYVNSVDFM